MHGKRERNPNGSENLGYRKYQENFRPLLWDGGATDRLEGGPYKDSANRRSFVTVFQLRLV